MRITRFPVFLSIAALTSVAFISAHYVVGEVEFLHQKLTPKEEATKDALEWTAEEPELRPLQSELHRSGREDGADTRK